MDNLFKPALNSLAERLIASTSPFILPELWFPGACRDQVNALMAAPDPSAVTCEIVNRLPGIFDEERLGDSDTDYTYHAMDLACIMGRLHRARPVDFPAAEFLAKLHALRAIGAAHAERGDQGYISLDELVVGGYKAPSRR